MFLYPEEIDKRLSWPLGRAERLACRHRLPHVLLPDGSIRFEWEPIEKLLQRVPVEAGPGGLLVRVAAPEPDLLAIVAPSAKPVGSEVFGLAEQREASQ